MELYLDCRLRHSSECLTWQQLWGYPGRYFIFKKSQAAFACEHKRYCDIVNGDSRIFAAPASVWQDRTWSPKLVTAAEIYTRRVVCLLLSAVSSGFLRRTCWYSGGRQRASEFYARHKEMTNARQEKEQKYFTTSNIRKKPFKQGGNTHCSSNNNSRYVIPGP